VIPRTRQVLLVPTVLALGSLGLAACGGGGSEGAAPSTAGAVTATSSGSGQAATVLATTTLTFAPETVSAQPGALALTMTIDGGTPHDLTFDDTSVGAPIPVTVSGSATQTFTFKGSGAYRFVCTLHSGMVGQVVVP